jgi:hypothetical protein
VLDLVTGQELRRWQGHQGIIWRLTFAPDGQTLLSGSQDQTLALWEPRTGREVARLAEHPSPVLSADLSPDGRLVASGHQDGAIGIWEIGTGKPRERWAGVPRPVRALAFSPDGKTLASAQDPAQGGGPVCLREVATGQTRWQTSIANTKASSLAFSPDGRTLALGGARLIQRWDLTTGRELRPLEGHLGRVMCLGFSPDGTRLASGSMDATVLVWPQPRPEVPAAVLAPRQLETLWDDLAGADTERAYRAVWHLAGAAGQAVPFLAARLPSAAAAEEPARGDVSVGAPAAGRSPELRASRALEVMERIGTPEASGLLQALAASAGDARLAAEARASLARRNRRAAAP